MDLKREFALSGLKEGAEVWLVKRDGSRTLYTVEKRSKNGLIRLRGYKWPFFGRTGECMKHDGARLEIPNVGDDKQDKPLRLVENETKDRRAFLAQQAARAICELYDEALIEAALEAWKPFLYPEESHD